MFNWLHAVDDIDEAARMTRPYEKRKGDADRAKQRSLDRIAKAVTKRELRVAMKENEEEFAKIPVDRSREVIKLGIVGEIFLVLEPSEVHNPAHRWALARGHFHKIESLLFSEFYCFARVHNSHLSSIGVNHTYLGIPDHEIDAGPRLVLMRAPSSPSD